MQSTAPRKSIGAIRTPAGCLVLGFVAFVASSFAWAQDLQVIELRHRLASDVIPIVEPLLEPGGVITGSDAMLFVRTSPANLAQIRQAVEALDRRPRQLLVTVRQGTVADASSGQLRGSATLGSGDVQAGVNRPPAAEPGATVDTSYRTQRDGSNNVSSVRTLEGMETYISVGQSVPVNSAQVSTGWGGVIVQQSTEFRSASTGFYATARLSGETVTLEISPQQQRLGSSARGPTVESAGAVTTVRGRLGEWLPLGAVQDSSTSGTAGLLVWGRQSGSSEYSVWIKVDEVP